MSDSRAPDAHLREIRAQPHALRRAADALPEQRSQLERLASTQLRPPLIFTGMGSSFDACYPAVEHLAERGTAAIHANSAEILHFRLPLIGSGGLLVLVSQSGRSAEVVRLAERVRASNDPPFVVSVTNGLDNRLAADADVALDTRTGPETAPSSTTFVATLVHLGAIARLAAGDEVARVLSDTARAADAAAAAIAEVLDAEADVTRIGADAARAKRTVVVLARGPARATAEMGALTMQECGIIADGFEAGAFRHGPFEIAGPGLAAFVVATEERTRSLDLGLAGDLAATGSDVVVLTDDAATPAMPTIRLRTADPLLSPAVSIVPIQLAAHRLALEAGRAPGSYTFATKVTTRE